MNDFVYLPLLIRSDRFDLVNDLHHDALVDGQLSLSWLQSEPAGTAAEGESHDQPAAMLGCSDLALCCDLTLRLTTGKTWGDQGRQTKPVLQSLITDASLIPSDKRTAWGVTVLGCSKGLEVSRNVFAMVVDGRITIRLAQKASVVPLVERGIPWIFDGNCDIRTGHYATQ